MAHLLPKQPRAQNLSPETPRRASAKRNYDGMDDNNSDASEYLPATKGRKRARTSFTHTGPGECPATKAKRAKRQRTTDSKRKSNDKVNLDEHSNSFMSTLAHITHRNGAPSRPPHGTARQEGYDRIIKQWAQLQTENQELKYKLSNCDNEVKKAQLDGILRVEGESKKVQQLALKYKRLQSSYGEVSKQAGEKDNAITQLTATLKVVKDSSLGLRQSVTALMSQVSRHQSEAQGYEDVILTAQEDIEALRSIDIEMRMEQERAKERRDTLPPAYGSLPDDTFTWECAHVEEAVDSGTVTIAILKHVVRSEFMKDIQKMREKQNELRGSMCLHRADMQYVLGLHVAFGFLCGNIESVLDRATVCPNEVAPHKSRDQKVKQSSDSNQRSAPHRVEHNSARLAFIADRIAKLLLDMATRLIAALELRPLDVGGVITPVDKNEIALYWSLLDTILVKALRCLLRSTSRKSAAKMAIETCITMQTYQAQVRFLQDSMGSMRMRANVGYYGPLAKFGEGKYLVETGEWLSDQLEVWRAIAANGSDEAQLADEEREDDILSERPLGVSLEDHRPSIGPAALIPGGITALTAEPVARAAEEPSMNQARFPHVRSTASITPFSGGSAAQVHANCGLSTEAFLARMQATYFGPTQYASGPVAHEHTEGETRAIDSDHEELSSDKPGSESESDNESIKRESDEYDSYEEDDHDHDEGFDNADDVDGAECLVRTPVEHITVTMDAEQRMVAPPAFPHPVPAGWSGNGES
ncbi:hypothetical protein LTR62_007416 [Meristemomyces frigidus]|uniref:Uncharacterized protein n=1 Tax=Meristemomyces frigidus TaxID=1508187 RepID=A0AAN7TQ53_9PEZI|nr:hypothetical protein LTR62_007416 [Meristemomyces frigidus]